MRGIRLLFMTLSLCSAAVFAQEPISSEWTAPAPIPDNGGSSTGNVGNNFVVLGSGRLLLVYNETNANGGLKLYQTVSDDDGRSWSAPETFAPAGGLIGACCVTLALDLQDGVHAVFMARTPQLGLYYSRSQDGGETWSAPKRISDTVRYKIDYHFITTDGKGRVHVFWHDGDAKDDSQPAEVMYTRSLDGGDTWETPRMLSSDDGAHSAFPRADFGFTRSDTLLVAWRDARPPGDDWDIYGAISYDGGTTWREELLAGGAGRQWDPMVQIDFHGTIHLGVMEYPAGHMIDVFVWYMRSSDGGTTWSQPQTMREARTIFPVFSYDVMQDVLWYFLRIESPPGPNATSDLGVRYSMDGGNSWSEVERLTALEQGGTKFPAFGMGKDGIPRLVYSLKDSAGHDKLYFQKRKSAPSAAQGDSLPETFFAVHCEPQTPHLFPKLIQLVNKANEYGILLTLEFTPQWVESIMADSSKLRLVREWQAQGHEVASHHHSVFHPHWDGFTNYPDSVIQKLGKTADYRGDMNAFRAVVEPIAGDSLLLTYSGPGQVDPDSSVDWQPDFIYRTGGGRQPERAFSSPRVVGMGPYSACQIDYYFLENQQNVDALKELYLQKSDIDVVGAVTHVFNFAADSNYVMDWFRFVQNTHRKTARQIMRDRGCQPDTALTAIEEGSPTLPLHLTLEQNYPNPFNPETTIRYMLPASADGMPYVKLQIYNIRGQRVRTLVQEFQRAGEHSVVWDGRDDAGQTVASGIYLYRLSVAGFSQVKQMVLPSMRSHSGIVKSRWLRTAVSAERPAFLQFATREPCGNDFSSRPEEGLSNNMSATPKCYCRESISVCFLNARPKYSGRTTLRTVVFGQSL